MSIGWETVFPPGEVLANDAEFVSHFADIYEKSPWVPEQAFNVIDRDASLTYAAIASLFITTVDSAHADSKLQLLRNHPDLAGRAAVAGELTEFSAEEQKGAGLDQCSAEEFETFNRLNKEYKAKFGFPFIIAVARLDRRRILSAFAQRVENKRLEEIETALKQVHKIARIRLQSLAQNRSKEPRWQNQ